MKKTLALVPEVREEECDHAWWHYRGQTPCTGPKVCYLCGSVKEEKVDCRAKAKEIWDGMDKNERAGVRFGLFPADKMQAAEKEGYDGHKLSCALMDCAAGWMTA